MFKHDIIKEPGVAVRCNTKKEAENFLSWAKSQGCCWVDGSSFDDLKYDYYLHHTCYQPFEGSFCSEFWYKNHGFTVIDYKEVWGK